MCIFMEMPKNEYICVFKRDSSKDFALFGSTCIGIRRLEGLH